MRLVTSASASPIASIAVVLVLGASPSEQASLSGPRSIVTFAARPSVLVRLPVMAMIGMPNRLERRQEPRDLFASRRFAKAQNNVSVRWMRPRSPCTASPGMHEMAPRAGRGERGGDLLADQPGLADAGDDHAPRAMIKFFHRSAKLRIKPRRQPVQSLGLDLDDLLGITKLLKRAQRPERSGRIGSRRFRAHRKGHP